MGSPGTYPRRAERPRDRRGRGWRGPLALPGPLTPAGVAGRPPPSVRFDELVRAGAQRLRRHLPGLLDRVEFAVEDTPLLPDDWSAEVPLGTHVQPGRASHAQVVVYRLPVLQRAHDRADTADLVLDVLVDELADLLGRDPGTLDPRPV